MTEVCDHMKLLWPHIAQLYCRQCGQPVRKESPQQVWEAVNKTIAADRKTKNNVSKTKQGWPPFSFSGGAGEGRGEGKGVTSEHPRPPSPSTTPHHSQPRLPKSSSHSPCPSPKSVFLEESIALHHKTRLSAPSARRQNPPPRRRPTPLAQIEARLADHPSGPRQIRPRQSRPVHRSLRASLPLREREIGHTPI